MTNPDPNITKPTQAGAAQTQPTIASGPASGPSKTAVTMPAGAPESLATLVSGGGSSSDKTMATSMKDSDRPTMVADSRAAPGTGIAGQVWGDFRVAELLGKGGMGSVYKGRQVSLDRPVAIKVLPANLSENEQFRERFALEAKAVAQISSPNVIQVYGAGVHDGQHYFAMEYVEGTDLARRLKDGYRPTYPQALDLVTQAARGLAAAGEHGIIHRDIKPGNMMITPKGVLKIMDFGLVKLAKNDSATGMTMAGTIMGTVNYFSPEQGRGERCDQRTDIYALGVVFYELLTRTLPFTGTDPTSVIYQHIHQAPRKPKEIDPQIPEDYQAVVLKCLQKKADDRYLTAEEMLLDLDCLRRGSSPTSAFIDPQALRSGGAMVRKALFHREKKRMLIAGALVAAALGGGGYYYWTTLTASQKNSVKNLIAPHPPASDAVKLVDDESQKAHITELAGAGDFAEARKLLEPRLKDHPDDENWKQLAQHIDRRHGEMELQAAQDALAKKDYDRAGRAAASAQSLIPDSPELKAVLEQLSQREGTGRQRSRTLNEVTNLLNEGKADKAQELLQPLHDANPDDAEIATALRLATKMREEAEALQAAVHDNLEKGDQAFARFDYDAAQLAYSMARQADPKSIRAKEGADRVNAIKTKIEATRTTFSAALKEKNLSEAEKQLAELRAMAPGSAVLVLAEAELERSKLIELEQRRRHSDLEAQMSAKAKDALAVISDPKQDLPAVEFAFAAFVRENGDRPERVMLEEKVEDRRQLKRIGQQLAELDGAMLHQDAKAIAAAVSDAEFAAALTELMTMPGLVFEQRIDDFQRAGKQGVLKVTLRHALTTFPERNLSYQYDVMQKDSGWVITAARLQQ